MPKPKAKHGRPRRAKALSEVSTVRIDDAAKELLQYEFGSLGNALYFIAEGIAKFRKRHGIGRGGSTVPDDGGALDFRDLVLMRDILWYRIDRWRGDAKAIAPSVELLRKLERMLYGEGVFYQSPPPIASDPVSEGVPLTRRRPRRSGLTGVDPWAVISPEFKASGRNPHALHPATAEARRRRRRALGRRLAFEEAAQKGSMSTPGETPAMSDGPKSEDEKETQK